MSKRKDLRNEYQNIVDEGLEQDTAYSETHRELSAQAKKTSKIRRIILWSVLVDLTIISLVIYFAPTLIMGNDKTAVSYEAIQQKVELFQKEQEAELTESPQLATVEALTKQIAPLAERKEEQREALQNIEAAIRKDLITAGISEERIRNLITLDPENNSLIVQRP